MDIINFDNDKHRMQVIELWKDCFGYGDRRNDPALAIDKKLAVQDGLFFIAHEEGSAVGTVMAGYDGHRGWIYSLAVRKEMRNRDFGSALLSHAEKELTERGCLKINLQVTQANEKVSAFYLKNGYRIEERISMGKQIDENIPQ